MKSRAHIVNGAFAVIGGAVGVIGSLGFIDDESATLKRLTIVDDQNRPRIVMKCHESNPQIGLLGAESDLRMLITLSDWRPVIVLSGKDMKPAVSISATERGHSILFDGDSGRSVSIGVIEDRGAVLICNETGETIWSAH